MYLGRPFSAPSSIKSKSSTKQQDATQTIARDKPMLINEPFVDDNKLIPEPKKLIIKLTI